MKRYHTPTFLDRLRLKLSPCTLETHDWAERSTSLAQPGYEVVSGRRCQKCKEAHELVYSKGEYLFWQPVRICMHCDTYDATSTSSFCQGCFDKLTNSHLK